MKAKDLTIEFPRSPFDELQGFPWLPRLIDKVRAKHANALGEYVPYPCGGDQRFLTTFGIDKDELEALIASDASDDAVASWCRAHAQHQPAEVAEAYLEFQVQPAAPERREYLEKAKKELATKRPDLDLGWVDNFTKLIVAEEGHRMPSLR